MCVEPTPPKLRIPFYYLFKMLFLLYIALPQTQGASYLYQAHLAPTLRAHESQIDAALAQLRMRVFAFLQARARMLWDSIVASATGPPSAPSASAVGGGGGGSAQQPPLSDSVSGPTQMLGTLWRTYGPAIVAGGTTLLQRQGYSSAAAPSSASSDATRGYDVDVDRPESSSVPIPFAQSRTSSAGSASGLRGRVGSGTNISPDGRFEEVEVPSDAESERAGTALPASAPRRSSGWFGWAAGAAGVPLATHEKAD